MSKKERQLRYESRERHTLCKASRSPVFLVHCEFVEAHERPQRVPKSTSVPASGDALHQPREEGVHRRRIVALRGPCVRRVHGRLRYERDIQDKTRTFPPSTSVPAVASGNACIPTDELHALLRAMKGGADDFTCTGWARESVFWLENCEKIHKDFSRSIYST